MRNLALGDIEGQREFEQLLIQAATKMLLGEDSVALAEGRAFGVQTLSGTGALRVGGEFLKRILGYDTVYISKPSWGNHKLLFSYADYSNIRGYR